MKTLVLPPRTPTARAEPPTVWGLTPYQVHDRFWASLGIQVVRQRERSEIVEGAELFLLCEAQALVIFDLAEVLETLNWIAPQVLRLRLRDTRRREYREIAVTDESGRFLKFERIYGDAQTALARVALTADPDLARLWQNAQDRRASWGLLKRAVPRERRATLPIAGHLYDGAEDAEIMHCLTDLMRRWQHPGSTIERAEPVLGQVWSDPTSGIDPGATLIGPVWVGAGRVVGPDGCVVGPAVLWDDPRMRPEAPGVSWQDIEPRPMNERIATAPKVRPVRRTWKRGFDVLFAVAILAVTLPFYPLICLAILIEDGRPFFFAHRRETRGGVEFPCIKFRSMRKDAEQMKQDLAAANQADGPQFYMDRDPRLTRVGRILRATQIDELPQFLNVLVGHMSVVGPRPSPRRENQFCPAWREARLSIRPGVTGLWQVKRTRLEGLDFQEWIRFDLEYVENVSFRLDLWILWKTVGVVMGGRK